MRDSGILGIYQVDLEADDEEEEPEVEDFNPDEEDEEEHLDSNEQPQDNTTLNFFNEMELFYPKLSLINFSQDLWVKTKNKSNKLKGDSKVEVRTGLVSIEVT